MSCENCSQGFVQIIQGLKRQELNQKHDITNLQSEIAKKDDLINKMKSETVN